MVNTNIATKEVKPIDAIAYMLYLETWLNHDETIAMFGDTLLKSLHSKWVEHWLPALESEHCGDCTKVACSCTRCNVENIYKDAERILKVLNNT